VPIDALGLIKFRREKSQQCRFAHLIPRSFAAMVILTMARNVRFQFVKHLLLSGQQKALFYHGLHGSHGLQAIDIDVFISEISVIRGRLRTSAFLMKFSPLENAQLKAAHSIYDTRRG
jgi:hypothetical protein